MPVHRFGGTCCLAKIRQLPQSCERAPLRLPKNKQSEIIQDHMNASHDRTGYLQDLNTIFPLDRLEEMEAAGEIGSVASYHYSFMGATDPTALESQARSLAKIMIKDEVDVVLLCPV